jgi:hypothetical protein
MSPIYLLDFATCKCGQSTPIRPSKAVTKEEYKKWIEAGSDLIFVACSRCKLVYSFEVQTLESRPSIDGLSPYHPDAPLHAFEIPMECDDIGCETPLPVVAVRKSATSAADLEKERSDWHWKDLKCPSGHAISGPPRH